VCTWGTRMGRRSNAGGGNGRRRTVCQLMHNSWPESIDTSSLSIAHEYETNATPVTYGVFPHSSRFFLTICLVSLNSKKSGARKNERRAKDDQNFSRVSQLLDAKKQQREYRHEVSNHKIRENFRGVLYSRSTKFSHELSLSLSLCSYVIFY